MSGGPTAQLDLGFARRGDKTVLDRRIFSWPFTLTRTFHLDESPAGLLSVILQTSSGAIHGADHIVQHIHVAEGAAAHVTTQGATAVHRARPGEAAREAVELHVEEGAQLEYLPEPRILFPGAALGQTVDLVCAEGGTAIVGDAFIDHVPSGESGRFERFTSKLVVRRHGGEPLFVDRMDLRGPPRANGARGAFRAFGALYLISQGRAEHVAQLEANLASTLAEIDGLYAAASRLPNGLGLGLRVAATNGSALRRGIQSAWVGVRRAVTGSAPSVRVT